MNVESLVGLVAPAEEIPLGPPAITKVLIPYALQVCNDGFQWDMLVGQI